MRQAVYMFFIFVFFCHQHLFNAETTPGDSLCGEKLNLLQSKSHLYHSNFFNSSNHNLPTIASKVFACDEIEIGFNCSGSILFSVIESNY